MIEPVLKTIKTVQYRQELNNFCDYLRVLNRSEHTIKWYVQDSVLFLHFVEKNYNRKKLKDIHKDQMRDFLASELSRGISRTSLIRRVAGIKNFFRFLLKQGIVNDSSILNVRTPKGEKKLPKISSETEVFRMLSHSFSDTKLGRRNLAILAFLYGTGARVSELIGLNVIDIDFRTGLVTLRGKGKKTRLVPGGQFVMKKIKEWLEVRKFPSDAVFTSLSGKRL